jgi:hypothetical protein
MILMILNLLIFVIKMFMINYSYIVIKYYFATQNNILCVIGYKISKEFIHPKGSRKLTKLIFLGVPFELTHFFYTI